MPHAKAIGIQYSGYLEPYFHPQPPVITLWFGLWNPSCKIGAVGNRLRRPQADQRVEQVVQFGILSAQSVPRGRDLVQGGNVVA